MGIEKVLMQGSFSVQMLLFFFYFFHFQYFFQSGYTRDLRSLWGITTTRSRPRRTSRRKEGEPEKSNCAPNSTQRPHLVHVVLRLTPASNRKKTKDWINREKKSKWKKSELLFTRAMFVRWKQQQNVLHIRRWGKQGHQMFFDVNNGIYY